MGHEPHLDHPGEITWWVGHGPAPILGDCPHTDCQHRDTSTIAYGPDFEHYELVICVEAAGCGGGCRGWHAHYPTDQVPDKFPAHRWWGFRAYDPVQEHCTTRAEAKAELDRIARERQEARHATA